MSVEFRKMKSEDQDKVVGLIQKFQEEAIAHHGFSVNLQHLIGIFNQVKADSFVAEEDGEIIGVFAGRVITDIFGGNVVYEEMMWYMVPTKRHYGISLLKYVEKRVKESNIDKMVIAHLCDATGDRLEKYYTRLGYKPLEVHYIREL